MTRINSHQVIQMLDDERLVFVDDNTGVEVVMPIARAKAIIDQIKDKLFDVNTEFVFNDGVDKDDMGKNQVMISVVHIPDAAQAIEYFATQAAGIKAANRVRAGTTPENIAEVMNVPPATVAEDPYVLEEFFVTFGVQYGPHDTVHPISPGLHHNGWVVIEATDYESARVIAFGVLGQRWSMIHERYDFPQSSRDKFYPAGELGRIKVNIPIRRES